MYYVTSRAILFLEDLSVDNSENLEKELLLHLKIPNVLQLWMTWGTSMLWINHTELKHVLTCHNTSINVSGKKCNDYDEVHLVFDRNDTSASLKAATPDTDVLVLAISINQFMVEIHASSME